jgi:hypothetical protein
MTWPVEASTSVTRSCWPAGPPPRPQGISGMAWAMAGPPVGTMAGIGHMMRPPSRRSRVTTIQATRSRTAGWKAVEVTRARSVSTTGGEPPGSVRATAATAASLLIAHPAEPPGTQPLPAAACWMSQ